MKALNVSLKTKSVPKEIRCKGAEKLIAKDGQKNRAKVLIRTLPEWLQKELDAIRARARNHHLYRYSLPLRSGDGHIVPGDYVDNVITGVNECQKDWNGKVSFILENYSRIKAEAEKAAVESLNKLLKEVGESVDEVAGLEKLGFIFPGESEIRKSFDWDLQISGMEDFSVVQSIRDVVGDSIAEEITKQLESRQETVLREIAIEAALKIAKVVENVHLRLSSGGVFRDSLVSNVRELVDILPGLNINNDPVIDGYVVELSEIFDGIDADRLREDEGLAREVASKSRGILEGIQKEFPEAGIDVEPVEPAEKTTSKKAEDKPKIDLGVAVEKPKQTEPSKGDPVGDNSVKLEGGLSLL